MHEEPTKACRACGVMRALNEYPPDHRRKDGRQSWCRSCYAELYRARKTGTLEVWKAAHRRDPEPPATHRRCNRCNETKPLDNFSPNKSPGSNFHAYTCKPCCTAWQRAYRAAKPDLAKAATRRHYEKHGEEIRSKALDYYAAHRDVRMEQMRAYNETHREQLREQDRAYRESHQEIRAAKNAAWRRANPEWCRDYYHRKRARRREVYVAPVSMKDIFERDRGVCQICRRRVKWDVPYPDPTSKSIDHIVPLSVPGATHEPRNCQLAHLRCNVSRGAGRTNAQLRLVG